jgi:hypothetical protein
MLEKKDFKKLFLKDFKAIGKAVYRESILKKQ